MGKEKSALPFGDQSLLEIAIGKALSICGNVAVFCGAQSERARGLAPAILDVRPPIGPLGGIEAALLQTEADWNLFLAVDTPLIPMTLLLSWWEHISRQEGVGASFMVDKGQLHALPLFLRREAQPLLSAALHAGKYRLQEEVEAAVKILGTTVLCVDADSLPINGMGEVQRTARATWFANANTPAEIEKIRRFAHTLEGTGI